MPDPIYFTKATTTQDVLYGDRTTSYRWEVLKHVGLQDQLIGTLDGVEEGSLNWSQNRAVKGAGSVSVADLAAANPGSLRLMDLALESVRLRPVQVIVGLPENPLGTFLVSASSDAWAGTGRTVGIELLDRLTVPSQDKVDQSYAVPAGALILQTVRDILAGCNEYIAINEASTLATASAMVWEVGTSKLTIINDLLDVANYNSLWIDGYGNFQLTPRVLPADRSLVYDLIGLPRELRDGEQAIYKPEWTRDKDSFEVPNKVIAVQAATGTDTTAIVGTWQNDDPTSPYSTVSRGRTIPYVLDSVECPAGDAASILAFLQARARATLVQMSAVQASVKLEHLPIPIRPGDALRFANSKAGIDKRHIITDTELKTTPTGLMTTTLQEVISL